MRKKAEKKVGSICGARSRRTGGLCRNPPMKGGATRCRMHGGGQQLLPPGDPKRGGRPIETGLYSRYLKDRMAEDYDAAANLTGVDHELRLARTYLARAIRQEQESKDGIQVIVSPNDKTKIRVRNYSEIITDLLERIRRLEYTRQRLLALGASVNTAIPGDRVFKVTFESRNGVVEFEGIPLGETPDGDDDGGLV